MDTGAQCRRATIKTAVLRVGLPGRSTGPVYRAGRNGCRKRIPSSTLPSINQGRDLKRYWAIGSLSEAFSTVCADGREVAFEILHGTVVTT
ncbi:hypothetical protein [Streptomyces rugosispiralis]|uniref:Uncharacterized protein n=1 Tax=Streptomyces rugosispiralis TaxID=2967341 RepID=A0ABT1URV3_9ACTN|nr:hypothetical protein [Streptomyces rugosispiralis]MCQ8187853.1 hypothetical protein [Streptomyces rugosispiralis]